jgi:hypothetical protein
MAWTLQNLQQFSVNTNVAETIWQSLYDWQLFPHAGVQQLSFFQNPIGQGFTTAEGAVVGSPKTILDTNMTIGGALATPTAFIVAGIEVHYIPGASAAANTFVEAGMTSNQAVAAATALLPWIEDVQDIYNKGGLQFLVGQKTYLNEAPLYVFPPSSYVSFDAAIGNADTVTHNMVAIAAARAVGKPFILDPAAALIANQNFNVTISFGGATATPSGFNGRIGVKLIGQFFRNAQ